MVLFFEIKGTGNHSGVGSFYQSQDSLCAGEKSDLQDSKLKIPKFLSIANVLLDYSNFFFLKNCSLLSHLI